MRTMKLWRVGVPQLGPGTGRPLEEPQSCELVSREAGEAMLVRFRACDDRDEFPRFLPTGTRIAFKTSSVDDIRTAAGSIDTPGRTVPVCVSMARNQGRRYDLENAG